jgi:F-type H+-transporting ATPase subunit b
VDEPLDAADNEGDDMNTLILAAEEGADAGASTLQLILPATAELAYGAIAFVVVLVLVSRFAMPKLNELLDERAASIQGQMEAAESARQEAAAEKAEYEAQLADARSEGNRVIEEAKQTAEQLRRDIVAKAEEEAEAIKARAQAEADQERERLVSELRGEVGRLSVELAGRIVGKELDASAHDDLVDEYITRLSRTN